MMNDKELRVRPIPVSAVPAAGATAQAKADAHPPKDATREMVETIVFVVFLVVLLRAFVAEAFVIPSGSMATTQLGIHRQVKCDKCGEEFTLNADRQAELHTYAVCPNCRYIQPLTDPATGRFRFGLQGGDKVLVAKAEYDIFKPKRLDVIVFKFPGKLEIDGRKGGPQKNYSAQNYIKRLWGLPGERLQIWYGDVYVSPNAENNDAFEVIRKPLDKLLEMRRIVYNNDHQASDLGPEYRRWLDLAGPGGAWKATDDSKSFEISGAGDKYHWLGYHHLLRQAPDAKGPPRPQLITDVLGYNNGLTDPEVRGRMGDFKASNWVGDLMLDFEVEIFKAEGELLLELSEGLDMHRASFDLQTGVCTLTVTRDGKEIKREQAPTSLSKTGKFDVRFANFDNRLTLWIDGKLPFRDGMVFDAMDPKEYGPRLADLRPASIGVKGGHVKVRHLLLYRDVYYTRKPNDVDVSIGGEYADTLSIPAEDERKLIQEELTLLRPEERQLSPEEQEKLARHRATKLRNRGNGRQERDFRNDWSSYLTSMGGPETYPANGRFGPDEYFALGDNSPHSSDSRDWGVVPERLLLGKAVVVYFPFWPFGPNRVGLIR